MSRLYNYRSDPNAKAEDVAFSYLTAFYENLPKDYQEATRRLAWDNQTLGEMTALMAQDIRTNFGTMEDVMARSSMALAALLFEHGTPNLKVAINLPATWPGENEEKGFLSVCFTGFAEKADTTRPHQISLIKPKKETTEERLHEFYPSDDAFHEKLGGIIRTLADQVRDESGDHSIMMMAMVINCWNALSALREPSVEINGEYSEIDGKQIPDYHMVAALQRERQPSISIKPKF